MRGKVLAAIVALIALGVLPSLYRIGLAGSALLANDEAIYCEMARAMVQRHDLSEITYEGERYFPRPPAAFWSIAAAYEVQGVDPPEPPLRFVCALLPSIEVALTVLLGCMLFGPFVGMLAGGVLAFSDLVVGYARAFESEPLLCCFILGAFCAWAGAHRRRGLFVVYGACLGASLMTKQLVGLFPLAAPIASVVTRKRIDRSGLALAIVVAFLVAAPWHVLMIVRHGHAFVDSFFLQSLVARAKVNLLWKTSPSFYLVEIWTSEHALFAILFFASSLAALVVGLARRRTRELLLGGWAIGPLVLYSIARSRYDYYILLSYPAFALSVAWLVEKLPLRFASRAMIAIALVVAAAAMHLPRNLVPNPGTSELREILSQPVDLPPSAPLYLYKLRAYAPRVYSNRTVRVFVDSATDVPAAEALRKTGMPASAIFVPNAADVIAAAERPSLLLVPKARPDVIEHAPATSYRVLRESKRYLLLELP